MYLISCQNCSSSVSVSPSQAGDNIRCGNCGENVPIPKLGELRKLPRAAEATSDPDGATKSGESTSGTRIGFVATAMIAVASLLVAGFCTLRWAIIDVPITTESHIAQYAEAYQTASPASIILDFEEMEERGIEMPVPYNYKRIESTKQAWGRNALISGIVAAAFFFTAMLLSKSRGKNNPI